MFSEYRLPPTALEDPFTFTVDGLGLTFRVNWKGGNIVRGHYTLYVDDIPFDDLAEYKEVVDLPKAAHSIK